ncbi:MAG: hypothetical protein ACFCD0_11940 [Gemmataceae bacterium]
MSWLKKWWYWFAIFFLLIFATILVRWFWWHDPGDLRLKQFVHNSPPVGIVFTSRSEPVSFFAAAPEGEGFRWPGQPFWQAKDGRLRLVKPDGTVHELTWGRKLDDGSRIIDVMSPSVSLDGRKVLFAGRTDSEEGRFRLFEIDLGTKQIRRLTGGEGDKGCVREPPLRYAEDATVLSSERRKQIDFDDIDPVYLQRGHIGFISSRLPDLGRGHSRRATQLWVMDSKGNNKHPITANRNNDRWPFLVREGSLIFSLWSRNTEVVTADLKDIRPPKPGEVTATNPTDIWAGLRIDPDGDRFGALVKAKVPVWRPRPLFHNRIVFMTPEEYPLPKEAEAKLLLPPMRLVQSVPGLIASVPSSRPATTPLPRQKSGFLQQTVTRTKNGQVVSLATPSPCPPDHIVVSAARSEDQTIDPGKYGICVVDGQWPQGKAQVTWQDLNVVKIFDDPEMVDAEPACVYQRKVPDVNLIPAKVDQSPYKSIQLANGKKYQGTAGQVTGLLLYYEDNKELSTFPGQTTDIGEAPIFPPIPEGKISTIRFYASHRDRFDDPEIPRKIGGWELLREVPVKGPEFVTWLPTTSPTVLAGFDETGHIVSWTSKAKDSTGHSGQFYAFAGDHYSGIGKGIRHLCTGCHAGHSGNGFAKYDEKWPPK